MKKKINSGGLRVRAFPLSAMIVALVLILFASRYVWVRMSRPPHRAEIVADYGSVGIFYGAPQSDSTGKRISYVETADVGFGVFICDVGTGKKTNVFNEPPTLNPDTCDLRVWPWAPDDSCCIYTEKKRIFLVDPNTGKTVAEMEPAAAIDSLAWLTPDRFVCISRSGSLYQCEKHADGQWAMEEGSSSQVALRSKGKGLIPTSSAFSRGEGAENACDASESTSWFSGRTNGSAWLQYEFQGAAWAITRYGITASASDPNCDPLDWQLLASNNGKDWTSLDTRVQEAFTSRRQSKEYTVSNQIPYRYYRLNISATSGGQGAGSKLAEWKLWSEEGADVVSANAENPPNEGAFAAFDGQTRTKWFNGFAALPNWLQYSFGGGAGWALNEYTLTSGNDVPDRDPRDWRFQASNDGNEWTDLDVRTNQVFSSRLQPRRFSFENSTPYRFYRLFITARHTAAGDGTIQLAEIDLGLKRLLAKISNPDDGFVPRTNGLAEASSGNYDRANSADKAFDGNPATSWFAPATNEAPWLEYRFRDSAWAIEEYKLASSAADAKSDPQDWELLGSSDGKEWTVLDSRTNQLFTERLQARRYSVANSNPYSMYRLRIKATAGGYGSGTRVGEFQLMTEDAPDSVAASAQNAPNEAAAKAFDGLPGTKWYHGDSPTGWLQFKFGYGEAQSLDKYSLTSGNDVPDRDPKTWQLLASNDGETWTCLDARTNETFEERSQTKSYNFENSVPYRIYRLNITAKRGKDTGLQLSEFNIGRVFTDKKPDSPDRDSLVAGADLQTVVTSSPFIAGFNVTALSNHEIAWAQQNYLWSMDLNTKVPRLLLNVQNAAPGQHLEGFSVSKFSGEFLLSCSHEGANSLWQFDASKPAAGLNAITMKGSMGGGCWIHVSEGDSWIAKQANYLMVQKDTGADPIRILPRANIDGFTVSPDGRQLFVLGTMKNEASAGIWQYDLAASTLKSAVPYGDHVSPYGIQENHTSASITLPSGEVLRYDIFPPADLYEHKTRKRPLIIGYTQFGVAVRGAHGRLWIPAMSSCGAYVVVANRGDWWKDIENWGDRVTAVYQEISKTLPIDKNRVFLFGASAETQYISQFVIKNPEPWAGVILLNPTTLPDFSKTPRGAHRPRILLSAGGAEGQERHFKTYESDALFNGVIAEYILHPKEGHHLVGNVSQLERTKALMHFVFEE